MFNTSKEQKKKQSQEFTVKDARKEGEKVISRSNASLLLLPRLF